MFTLESPPERLWFVVVTAPLVLGAVPLVLEFASVVGQFSTSQAMFNGAMIGVYLVAVGLSGVFGTVAASWIHHRVDISSRLSQTINIDQTAARATTVVFGVFVLGAIASFAGIFSLSGPGGVVSAVSGLVIPLAPLFFALFCTPVDISSLVGGVAFMSAAATTGIWQVILGTLFGRVSPS